MKVHFRTNLDLLRCELWPNHLDALPREGDYIESGYEWNYFATDEERAKGEIPHCKTRLILKVYKVTWKAHSRDSDYRDVATYWVPEVELNIPTYFENMKAFYEWYGKITGKGKSYFI